jgi:very-short-patch-repair endonuclease
MKVAMLAERQHGVVAYRQLLELGIGRGAIHRRVRAGVLHPVHRGVYCVGHRRIPVRGRWMAAVLACGPTALLSHGSAALLWGLLMTSGSRIDVMTARRTRHNRSGIALHRTRRLHPDDRSSRDGIPVTSVARTLLDLAPRLPSRRLARAIDQADRLAMFDMRAAESLLRRSGGHPGRGPLERALRGYRTPAATRSELERRFLSLCQEAGLPRPQANVAVEGVEVDIAWPDRRLVVELDGYEFHRTRARFEQDRSRDGDLLIAGYRVLRITHRRLESDAPGVVATVRRLLASGGG